jgi:hypothetical protein
MLTRGTSWKYLSLVLAVAAGVPRQERSTEIGGRIARFTLTWPEGVEASADGDALTCWITTAFRSLWVLRAG